MKKKNQDSLFREKWFIGVGVVRRVAERDKDSTNASLFPTKYPTQTPQRK